MKQNIIAKTCQQNEFLACLEVNNYKRMGIKIHLYTGFSRKGQENKVFWRGTSLALLSVLQ